MNKDILFSMWYDSLEGTKSQGFAYKAWCAGWEAALKPIKCDCISPEKCDLYDRCLKGRAESKSDFKTQMDDNWSGII